MTDDENQALYEAMQSDLETASALSSMIPGQGPTVVRSCRQTLGATDTGAYRERHRPFRTAPTGIYADTRQTLRAIRMAMDRHQFWPAIYHLNDDGNVTLLSSTGREIAAWV